MLCRLKSPGERYHIVSAKSSSVLCSAAYIRTTPNGTRLPANETLPVPPPQNVVPTPPAPRSSVQRPVPLPPAPTYPAPFPTLPTSSKPTSVTSSKATTSPSTTDPSRPKTMPLEMVLALSMSLLASLLLMAPLTKAEEAKHLSTSFSPLSSSSSSASLHSLSPPLQSPNVQSHTSSSFSIPATSSSQPPNSSPSSQGAALAPSLDNPLTSASFSSSFSSAPSLLSLSLAPSSTPNPSSFPTHPTLLATLASAEGETSLPSWSPASVLQAVVDYAAQSGAVGVAVFIGAYATATVFLIPGSILTLAAGALYGPLWGTAIVSAASTSGAVLAFLVCRYLAKPLVEKKLADYPKATAIVKGVSGEGGKLVFFLRLSPLVPFTLLNYALGLTQVPLWQYTLASWVGMLPGTFAYVYLGGAGKAAIDAAGSGSVDPVKLVLWGVGAVATIGATKLLSGAASKALAEAEAEAGSLEAGVARREREEDHNA